MAKVVEYHARKRQRLTTQFTFEVKPAPDESELPFMILVQWIGTSDPMRWVSFYTTEQEAQDALPTMIEHFQNYLSRFPTF